MGAVDDGEPERVAEAADRMDLRFAVVTMVTRDDLADGGAGHVARTIQALRDRRPQGGVEVLISDMKGNRAAIETVLAARPDVLNHNLETVPRLYAQVRPGAVYQRSLDLIAQAAGYHLRPATKSGLMLGLGETRDEIRAVLNDLKEAGCDLLTLGQYLQPSDRHRPVAEFVPPQDFDDLAAYARKIGFKGVAAGPYVRSSYRAAELHGLAVRP
jgi:lipoic acid synthetase